MTYAFSDGNPFWEYSVFLILFLFFCCLGFLPVVQAFFGRAVARLAAFVRQRRALREHGLVADLRKIDLVRIFVGTIATLRYGEMCFNSLASGNDMLIGLAGFATLVSMFVVLGFMTPVATFLLMSTGNLLIDNLLGASTLGTMVMSMTLLLFLLAPAGRTLSVDAWLAERKAPLRYIAQLMHRLSGPVGEDRLLVAKIAALFAYFCVCLYSVSWHTNDDAWTSGFVIAWVLLSPAANPHYSSTIWELYQSAPWLLVIFSQFSVLCMVAWYVLTLPGIFMGRWVRAFVIFWGLAFFLISTFVLPLSYLGWYELALWFALFAAGPVFGSQKGPALAILFDDRCNLCDRTVKVLARLDLFGRLEFRPIRRNLDFAAQYDVTLQEGLTDLVGVDLQTGTRTAGFDLYDAMASKILFLWALKPFFWLARLTGVGPLIYRWVADRRTKLFGVCEFSNIPDRFFIEPVLHLQDTKGSFPRHSILTIGTVGTLLVLAAAFLVRLPILSTQPDERFVARWSQNIIGAAPTAFGIHKINVFNSADLAVFRFTMSAYVYPEGADLAAESLTAPLDRLVFIGSDAQTYGITAHSRRMARTNIGCDREFFMSVMPIIKAAYVSSRERVLPPDVMFEFGINAWPTSNDLSAYTPISSKASPLCRVRLNLESEAVTSLTFVQSGVNEAIRQKGFPPIINAKHAETAIRFPCRYDAAFLGALSTQHPNLTDDPVFSDALKAQRESKFGRFNADCLLDSWQITNQWPQLFDTSKIEPNADMCQTGLALLSELSKSNQSDQLMSDRMAAAADKVSASAAAGNISDCVRHAVAGWQEYWRIISVPEA